MFNNTKFTANAEEVIIAKNSPMQIVKAKCLHQDQVIFNPQPNNRCAYPEPVVWRLDFQVWEVLSYQMYSPILSALLSSPSLGILLGEPAVSTSLSGYNLDIGFISTSSSSSLLES